MRRLALLAACLPVASLAAVPAPDEWKRVPVFPTVPFQSADGFAVKLEAADGMLARDLEQQKQINQEMQEKIKTIDPMELASRQQQYMMDHPQEAMALMQRNATLGQTFTDTTLAHEEERKKLDQELRDLDTRYQAALDKVLGPIEQKLRDLDARASKALVPIGEMYGYPEWASKEWRALIAEKNAAYAAASAEWWAAAGPYQGWLKRYREHLTRQIPVNEETENVGAGFMVQIVGTPTRAFKPTATLRAVKEYLERSDEVFKKRWAKPDDRGEGMVGK